MSLEALEASNMNLPLFLRLAVLAVCASAASACGGTVKQDGSFSTGTGTGASFGSGTGAGGSQTTSGTGAAVGASPDAAWVLNINGQPQATCNKGVVQDQLGNVTATAIITRITDGQPVPGENGELGAVSCSVTGTGPFAVQGSAATTDGAKILIIEIPSISPSATQAAPATGSVTYESAQVTAEVPYQGNNTCSFWFTQGTQQSVASGKVWATFTCSLSDPESQATCGASTSYVVFENCATQ
jgi:hypothetical protein